MGIVAFARTTCKTRLMHKIFILDWWWCSCHTVIPVMTGAFLSVPSCHWCAPMSLPPSYMLVNHGPSQQNCKEEYKPWKCCATARYYASHTRRPSFQRGSPAKLQQAIGPREDLLTVIRRRILLWCGHVSHSLGLVKTIWLGTMKRGGRQGRQKKWEDNIRKWKGLEFAKS